MTDVKVVRTVNKKYEAWIEYSNGKNTQFEILEDTNLVDGIGGTAWDGAVVLSYVMGTVCEHLKERSATVPHVVELGCGTGLCGLAAASAGCKVTLTDRHSDLAQLNQQQWRNKGDRCQSDVAVYDLSWEAAMDGEGTNQTEQPSTVPAIVQQRGAVDLLIGAEITCLRKQQPILVNTIAQFLEHSPDALVLLSFDDAPPPNGCRYEEEMLSLMRDRGFRHEVVCVADVDWTVRTSLTSASVAGDSTTCTGTTDADGKATDTSFNRSVAVASLRDRTAEFVDVTRPLVAPFVHRGLTAKSSQGGFSTQNLSSADSKESVVDGSHLPLPPPPLSHGTADREKVSRERTTHHITLFYRPFAVGVCSRCQRTYFRHPVWCNSTPCVYHEAYFVCRYHPAEVRCSINGAGDGLGYYGNGREGYAAKFWDCCGSEDPAAPGCREGRHVQY